MHTNPTKEKPILSILDGHCSHKSLDVIEKCRENHIHLLTLPPHTSHRMQPLNVSFFWPLKNKFDTKMDEFTKTSSVNIEDIIRNATEAYIEVANLSKASSGFEKTGIHPKNIFVFDDDEFYKDIDADCENGSDKSVVSEENASLISESHKN